MHQTPLTRRTFLETASLAGIAVASSLHSVTAATREKMPPIKKAIYVCSICGHVEFGTAPDACPICHAPKEKFGHDDTIFTEAEKKFGTAEDKHLPVITASSKSKVVMEKPSISAYAKIGSVIHPMEKDHHIRFIDCYIDDAHVSRLLLTLNNHPTAGLEIKKPGKKVRFVIQCNLHGYWQNEITVS